MLIDIPGICVYSMFTAELGNAQSLIVVMFSQTIDFKGHLKTTAEKGKMLMQ